MLRKNVLLDDLGIQREVGELWIDRAGNECHFRENGAIDCLTVNIDPSMAVQSERDKCDLNVIKGIYDRTGVMNNVRNKQPTYGDFTTSMDLQDVYLRVQQAEEDFMLLDAQIRARFENDPGKLIDFVRDPKNLTEAIQLGLLEAQASSPQAPQVPQGEEATPPKEGV